MFCRVRVDFIFGWLLVLALSVWAHGRSSPARITLTLHTYSTIASTSHAFYCTLKSMCTRTYFFLVQLALLKVEKKKERNETAAFEQYGTKIVEI